MPTHATQTTTIRRLPIAGPGAGLVLAGAALASALAGGCAWQPRVNTAQAAERQGTPAQIEDQRLIWDRKLAKALRLVGLIEGQTPDGLKKVEAELFNASGSRVAIRYRFEWFDAQGFAVDSPMDEFRDLAVLAGERARISAIAPSHQAVDFELEIVGAP